MKNRLLVFITFSFLFISCASNEESLEAFKHPLTALSIKFVNKADGKEVKLGACVSPDILYAIQIETLNGSGSVPKVTNIEYIYNGILYVMSFSEAGIGYNPIELVEGKNIVQLLESGLSNEIMYVLQDDFVRVE
jgi:hypothetical protein